MSSRLIKGVLATALAAPFAVVVGMHSASAYDCHHPYGAHQGGSRAEANCNDAGVHLSIPNGKPYTVTGKAGVPFEGVAAALCDGAGLADISTVVIKGANTADSAVSIERTGATAVLGAAGDRGRIVGYLTQYADNNAHTITVNCLDDRAPFDH
jgi:hypothetical protein